jgi:beta-glucanase (GH16 family)
MRKSIRFIASAILSIIPLALVSGCPGQVRGPGVSGGDPETVQPFGRSGSYRLDFNDEFDGSSLNLDRWTTCYWWDENGCTNLSSNEKQWYLPDNVSVENGNLVLTARREAVVGFEGQPFPYTSGMVTTGRYYQEGSSEVRFQATGGFFEMRAKLPSGQGFWPAFWMLPSSLKPKPEIDIMELLGKHPDSLELHFHYKDEFGEAANVGRKVETVDLSEDWHIFGVDWSSDRIVWYLDGVEMWRYTDQRYIPKVPMYLIVNLAVGGDWPGDPDSTTVFPTRMLVDYVRAWSRQR